MNKTLCILLLIGSLLFGQTGLIQEEQDFRFAEQLAAKGMQDLAGLQYVKYAETYPSSPRAPEALFRAAESYRLLKDHVQSAALYQQLMLKYPQSAFVDKALYHRADILMAHGDYLEAALSFERLRLFTPTSEWAPLAMIRAAQSFLAAGELQRTLDSAHLFLESYPASPLRSEARYILAQVRSRQQQPLQTLQELDRILGDRVQDSLTVKAQLLAGRTLYQMGSYQRADSLFRILLNSPVTCDSLGAAALYFSRLLHYRNDFAQSNQTIKAFLAKHPMAAEKERLLFLQGDNFYGLQDYAAALESYATLAKTLTEPEQLVRLWLRQAFTLKKANRDVEALKKLQDVLAVPDTLFQDRSLRSLAEQESARWLCALGRPAEALQLLRRALNHSEADREELLFVLASVQKDHLKDYAAAAETYITLGSLFPNGERQDDALWGQAHCLELQGRYDEARQLYARYTAAFPAGDQVEEAQSREHYLQNFFPMDAAGLQLHLQRYISEVLAGLSPEQSALAWAEKLSGAFHDYAQALTVIRQLSHTSLSAEIRDRVLALAGRCHLALAEKAFYDGLPAKQQAHQDSCRQIVRALPGDPRARILGERLFMQQIFSFHDARQRLEFMNAPQSREAMNALSDSSRKELGLALAESYYEAANDKDPAFLRNGMSLCRPLTDAAVPLSMRTRARLLQARFYRSLNRPDSAAMALHQLVMENPGHPLAAPAWWELAELRQESGKPEEALSLYQDIQAMYPYSEWAAKAQQAQCRLLFQQGRYSDAGGCVEKIESFRVPQDLALFFPQQVDDNQLWFYASSQEAAGDPMTAVKAYQTYLLKSSNAGRRAMALMRLADLSAQLGYGQASLGHYQELLTHYPQDSLAVSARRSLADGLFRRHDYAGAKTHYVKLKAEAGPELRRYAESREIVCEYRLKNSAAAKRLAEAFKKQYSDRQSESQFLLEEAELAMAAKDFKSAESLYRDVAGKVKESAEASQAELGLARLYILLNKNDDALRLLTTIPDRYKDPKVAGAAYVTLGEFYYANQQFENCINAGRKAYELVGAPEEKAQAMQLLIRVYDDVHMWDRGISLLREYLQTYPQAEDLVNRKVQLGIFLMNLKEYDRAIAYLKELKWSVDAETEAEIQYWIAKSYNERGSAGEAIIEYLKVKYLCKPTKLPWGTTALYEAGQAYYKLGELEKARSLYQSIVRELGSADQFGRVAAERVHEIDLELAKTEKRS
ncbi:MAG TPA: tetratricopeptide repeat protein [bacterium]|nr:tetratricopeptide repeat protein [bacterium]